MFFNSGNLILMNSYGGSVKETFGLLDILLVHLIYFRFGHQFCRYYSRCTKIWVSHPVTISSTVISETNICSNLSCLSMPRWNKTHFWHYYMRNLWSASEHILFSMQQSIPLWKTWIPTVPVSDNDSASILKSFDGLTW